MSSNDQRNEEYFHKLAILQKYVLDIVEAETFEEIAKLVFDVIETTIDPFFMVVGQVRFGAIRGFIKVKGDEVGILNAPADGMPLDGAGVMVRAVNTGKIYNVPDTRKDPDYVPAWVESESHTLSEIAVPILVQGKSIGIINIEEAGAYAFDISDQKILEALAGYAGVSLSNIIYSNRLNGLHKHTSKLNTLTSVKEVAEQTLDAMTDTLELESCAFLLPQEGTIYEKGLEKSIQLREKVVKFYQSEMRREADDIEFLSELETPVNVDDEVAAILNARSIQPEKYTEQDKQLLEILASYVATAIQRIILIEEQIQYEAKLEGLHTSAINLDDTETIEDISRFIRARAISDILDYEWVGLGFVYDNKIRYFYDTKDEKTSEVIQREYVIDLNDNTIITRAAKTGEIQDIPNTELDPDFICTVFNDEGEPLIKSEYTIPIIQFGKVVAVLNAESIRYNAFSEQYKKLLEILASHISSAIQRIRLLEKQQQYESKLKALHDHTSHLAEAGSIEKIAEYTIDAMSNTLGYKWGLFMLLEGDQLISLGMLGEYIARGYSAPPIPLNGPGITTRTARTGKTQLVNDTRLDPDHYSSDQILSELDVPIKIEDKVIGVLNVESDDLNAFTEQDQELLEILASHVSSAIQKIRLLEEQIQYETKLEALHLHTTKLADAKNIKEISEHTIEAMETTLGFSFAVFNIVEDKIWKSIVRSRSGLRTYDDDYPVHINGPGIGARAIRTKETQLVNDVRKDVDYIGPFMNENTFSKLGETHEKELLDAIKRDASAGEWVSLSELDVPVKIDQTVVAVLNAESDKLNAFTEQDIYLLETLASHVASAIQRIRLQEEREQVQQELALERVRVEQADELDRMKNQFISTATHELRTPVTSIIGFLELVLDYSSEELSDSVRNDLNIVFRNAMRLVDMTNDLLDVQRITSGRFEVTLEQVEIIKTLNEVIEELTPLFTDKNQTLHVNAPSELMVNVDETRISQLLINIIRNANKFTPEEGKIEITVEPSESHIQISVKDSGIGLSEEDIGKLFTPFPDIQHDVNVSSTGLGLAICKGIVDLHNGEIWAESEGKGMGSTFFVKIPLSH